MQKILVVDDAKPNIRMLAELLSDQAQVLFATNGAGALQKAADEELDLILLDVVMPGMDGYEVCRILKSDPATARIPIVFITSLSDEDDEEKGLKLGAIDYIAKPFSPPIVRARVRNHLLARQQQRDLEIATERLRSAHEREMRIAHDIQMAMLSLEAQVVVTSSVDAEIGAVLEPARSVGGDLYNYFLSSPKRLCVAVGDVSDKGVPAALFMVKSNTLLRTYAELAEDPGLIMEKVNRELCRDNDAAMFLTLLIGILDLETGEIALANGGHNPPVLRGPDGASTFIEFDHGPALGLIDEATFPVWRSRLTTGQTLVLYTDGVTEAFDSREEMYSDERLLDVVPTLGFDMAKDLLRSVQDFAGDHGQSDDITVLTLRYDAREAGMASEVA